MLKNLSSKLLILSLFLFALPAFSKADVDNKIITLATTTSTENSGLLKVILPRFEEITGYKVRTIAVGTGKALRMGRDGDVDVLLVHAKKAEDKFMADGDGERRLDVMYNDFVIVGPKDDPAKLSNSKNIREALRKIASTKNAFISRGDNSGTHKKELHLWESASIDTKSDGEKWYIEAGQGMGKVLQMAGEMNAYTLTDRGTWLAYESKSPLRIVYEGDTVLFNPYGIIAVSSKKYPDLNTEGAYMLMDWIVSKETQLSIGQFKIAGKVLFTPNAASPSEEDTKQAK